MIDNDALRELARELEGREKVIYTESRFDDLFDFPPDASPARTSLRLIFQKDDGNLVSLRYRSPANLKPKTLTFVGTRCLTPPNAPTAQQPGDRKLFHYAYRGAPVGLHAWETLLRENVNICQSPETDQITEWLSEEIAYQTQLVDAVFAIVDALSPTFFFSGHDCYASATIKNAFILKRTPSLTLYKYMYNPIYRGPNLHYEEQDKIIFSRRLSAMRANFDRPIWKTLSANAKEKLNSITQDYKELNYIRAQAVPDNHAEYNYERSTGWSKMQSLDPDNHFWGACGDRPLHSGEPIFIFALHSFADEAAMYGLDDFAHMFDYFSAVAGGISEFAPKARIAVRFHPNTLGENLHEVEKKDCDLQRALFQKIRLEQPEAMVSCCSARLGTLSRKHQISVVTRWGTIGLECMHLGLPFICSSLAPYASFLDGDSVISRRKDFETVISAQMRNMQRGDKLSYPAEKLYPMAASTFFHENGKPRAPSFVFSIEGASYLAARGRSDKRIRETLGDAVERFVAGGPRSKQETCEALKQYLKDNTETAADAKMLEEHLGW